MQSERKNGLRVTPDAHMPIVCSVLAGELNKQLVATAAKYDINAVGISLADGGLADCHAMSAELGAVGVPKANSPDLLNALFNVNLLPIIASVGKDNNGRLYNVNADHAAICLAELLQTKLYFFADVPGVLDANKHLINTISKKEFDALVNDEVITDGMIVKVEAALQAANQIQQPVTIASWDDSYSLLVDKKPCGTQILPEVILRA
jgi:acetylglutamate kinase